MTATAGSGGTDGPAVFLSYARENQSYAVELRDRLAAAPGVGSVFVDTTVGSADRWELEITRALEAADVVVCLLGGPNTPSSEPSPSQQYELDEVRKRGRAVVAVVVEGDVDTAKPADVPRDRIVSLRRTSWDADVERIADLVAAAAAVGSARRATVDTLLQRSDLFVGRRAELDLIAKALVPGDGSRPRSVVIAGPAGVGKTSLAAAAARDAARHFPDGRVYVNLQHRDLDLVLREILTVLGFDPSGLPPTLGGMTVLYRSVLREQRVLVVVDDAESWEVVRSLLPVTSGSAALITTRSLPQELTLDESIVTVPLGGLDEDTALQLLRESAGPDVVDSDEASARSLARTVSGLPLALRLAASRARRDGESSLRPVLSSLTEGADGAAATSQLLLDQAYGGLSDADRRLFRLLGALPTPTFEAGLAAALDDTDAEAVAVPLRTLADAALIDAAGTDHYRLSDVAARFAAGRLAAEEPEAERQAAVERLVRWISVRTAFQPEMPITRDFWTADDTLGYAPYADAIAAFVRHRGTRPPLTIGVTAPWGAGKTSLMRMVQERLDPRVDRDRWTPTSLRLSEDARRALAPGRVRDTGRPVTNRELLQRTTEPPIDTDDADPRRLDVQPPHAERLPDAEWRPTVWFNPWMYQSGEQIWAGLAYEIITQVTGRLAPADRERFWLALNLRRVDKQALRRRIYRQLVERFLPWLLWLGLAVVLALAGLLLAVVFPPVAGIVRVGAAALVSVAGTAFGAGALYATVRFLGAKASGSFGPLLRVPNPVKAAADQSGKGAKGAYNELFPDPAYETKLGFLHLVQTDMRRVLDLVATQQRPLVVFVDDLDRCSPGAVVQVIEAINLFLAGEFPNCVFVVAMEPAVVAAHVEAVYKDLAAHPEAGRSTLGWRFLEKIVQLPLSLPPPDTTRQTTGYLSALLDPPPAATPSVRATSAQAAGTPSEPSAGTAPTGPSSHRKEATDDATDDATAAPNTAGDGDRAARVRQLEAAIRRRSPTTGTLAAAALQAQAEVVPGAAGTLLPETSEAANRVLVELYSDSEARTAILAGVPGLASDNPREIKRFVNLFRFYSFIAQQHQLQGLAAVSGTQIAKLAVLAIRWPHLLGVFGRRFGDGPASNLGHLEQALRSTAGTTDAWREALRAVGLAVDGAEARMNPASAEHFRRFLATEPTIAAVADRML